MNKLFSIENKIKDNNKWHKVIYILGIKISFRNKRKERREATRLEKEHILKTLDNLKLQNNKLSEALKVQQGLLQKQNNELSEKLKQQNDEINKDLKLQHNELKVQKELLKKQSNELESQNKELSNKINILDGKITNIKIDDKLTNIQKSYNMKLEQLKKDFRYKLHKYCCDEKRPDLLKDWFSEHTGGGKLDLENPQTFNEKIQWLKLYDSTPEKTRLADKYLVRDWVKEKIGEEYLIPLLGVWDKFDDINFDKLPEQFVLKCNHGSGYNIIVKDKSKLDIDDARKKINTWMNEDFAFKFGLELHYSPIPRKIIAEKYISKISEAIYDYRFFCFNGICEQIWLDISSGTPEHERKIYDKNWNELNIEVTWPRHTKYIEKPKNLDKMIELAQLMSKDFAMVRVDFYNIENKIYFGEMTFTSMSGTGKFNPESANLQLGELIKLPKR